MTSISEAEQIAKRLATEYKLRVPSDLIASTIEGRPKVPVMLSRASFRPDTDVRTKQRTRIQRERRNFLRGMFGLAAISLSALILFELTSISSSQPQVATSLPGNSPSNSGTGTGRLIANAANVPPGQSLTLNDPSLGPLVVIHLDNGLFVAFSSICTHAGCQVQFDPSVKNLVCPCHGAVYDPSNNAQVLGGPAPYPLQKIPIQYNPSTGNIYLTS